MNEKKINEDEKKVNHYLKNLLSKKHLLRDILDTPIQLKLKEKINIINATYILYLSQDNLEKFLQSNHGQPKKVKTNTDIKQLRMYLYYILQNGGELEIDYNYSKNKIGRVYSETHSLQRLNANLKNYLTDGIYDDVDIENAHPTIILLLGDIVNLHTPHLKEYVEHRKKFLEDNKLTKLNVLANGCYTDIIDNNAEGKTRQLYEDIKAVKDYYYNVKELRSVFGINQKEIEKLQLEKNVKKRGRPSNDVKEQINLDNLKSSFLGNLLGYIENKIVNYTIVKNNLNIGVNMFDGFLIDKDTVDIKQLNLTLKKLGIKWTKKPMTYVIKEGLEEFDFNNCMVYNQFKKEFEKTHFIIQHPFQLITKKEDEAHISVNPEHFKLANSNIMIQKLVQKDTTLVKDIKLVKFVNAWLDDPKRKSYEKTVYIPYTCKESMDYLIENKIVPKNAFNVFNGFDRVYVEQKSRGKFKKDLDFVINDFLLNIISDKSETKQKYLLSWIGHLIQKPREKPLVALCIFGTQGAGKGFLCNIIKGLLDFKHNNNHSFVSQGKPEETIFNRFNSCISNKLLLELNEFGKKNYIEIIDKLKPLITDHTKTIEIKNINGQQEEINYSRVIIVSDKASPMSLTTEERRYFIVKVSPDWKVNNKSKNFKKLDDLLDNNDFMNCLYSYFMDYDISSFQVGHEGVPITEEYETMVEDNLRPVNRFLKEEFLDNFETHKPKLQQVKKFGNKRGIVMVNSKDNQQLIEKFRNWFRVNNYTTEYKNWNNQKYRTQLRDAPGIYGFEKQFLVKLNGKPIQHIFIVIDEVKKEIDRIMPSFKNEEVIDDIDASKISSDSSTNTTIFSDSDSGSDFDTSLYN